MNNDNEITYNLGMSVFWAAAIILFILILPLLGCQGPRGDHGDLGSTGAAGAAGSQGAVGPQGPAGSNGVDINPNPVTWIQFCPGTPSYPSKFIEGGFCIAGNVYAVYSANDGFMTYLPPGAYASNAINSSCSFTLLANCRIQ